MKRSWVEVAAAMLAASCSGDAADGGTAADRRASAAPTVPPSVPPPATTTPSTTPLAEGPPTTAPPAAEVPTTAVVSTAAATAATATAPITEPAAPDPPPTATASPSPGDRYPAQPAGVPYPTAEWPVGQLPASVDRAALDAAVDAAFGAPDAAARVRSIVVVQGGTIVYERYHPLDGPDVRFPSFSVAKSFTSAMIGLLVADGELSLDESPAVPEWQAPGDPRQAITLRQLLQMSSGLEWTEEYGADSLAIRMLQAPDAAAFVAAQPLEAEPGSTFEYSTGTTALLAGIAADELGGCPQMLAYVNEQLLDAVGITSDQFLTDANGCWFGGLGADMTTRDFARFGLLYLRGGAWDGRQILPTAWIDESRVPAATNPTYGLQWWLSEDGRSFSAEGLFGQRIVVVPDADLVIATNSTQGGDPFTMVDAVLAAFGAR